MPRWKTLFELCVEACVVTLPTRRNPDEARLLPPALKTRILERLGAKGLVNEAILRALLHRDTPELSLGWRVTVDDGMLRTVAARCRRLTRLYLEASGGDNDKVTAAGLLELFPAVGANLTELHLLRCPAVDDAVVAEVARCCPRLWTLDLEGCREVGDGSLVALADLEGLTNLYISDAKVSNDGIVALVEGGSQLTLREIMVDNCPAVTDYGLRVALMLCRNLNYLSFKDCPDSSNVSCWRRTPGDSCNVC